MYREIHQFCNFFFPLIELNSQKHYVIGFVDLWSFNFILNIFDGHNKISFVSGETVKTITRSTGKYELDHLANELKSRYARENIEEQ